MSSILDKVAQIRQAVYGKDVRENIASGIESINAETVGTTAKQTELETAFDSLIINAGDSNAEIVVARLGEVDLPTKIGKMDDSQLVLQSQFSTLIANAGDVSGNAELLGIRTDSQGYAFQTASKRLINTEKFIRSGVTELKFNDWEIGNLDNSGLPTEGTTSLRSSVFHSFTMGEIMTIEPVPDYEIVFFGYDASMVISKIVFGILTKTQLVVAHPYYKFKLWTRPETTANLTFPNFVAISVTDGLLTDGDALGFGSVDVAQLQYKSVTPDKCDFLTTDTKNLLDPTKMIENYLLDYQGLPILKTVSNAGVTDFTPVQSGVTYTYKRINLGIVYTGIINGYVFYDKHKKFISITVATTLDSLVIPVGVRYIRIYFNSGVTFAYFRDECVLCKLSDFNNQYLTFLNQYYLSDNIKIKQSNIVEGIDNTTITRWGDSMTAKSSPTNLATLTGLPVSSQGAGGELAITIASRMGVFPILAQPFTIPADLVVVDVELKNSDGNQSGIMRLNTPGINPCTIDGVVGTLAIVQATGTDPVWSYTFVRSVAGSERVISRPVKINTNAMQTRLNDIATIWAGTNDSPKVSDVNLLALKIQSMIDNIKSVNKKYIIVGLTKSYTMAELSTINNYLSYSFGSNFLEINSYLVEFGLADAGLTATAQDLIDIANNTVPTSLREDSTHLTPAGYLIVDNLINLKLRTLGYIV